MNRVQDIHIGDVNLKNQYVNRFLNGNYNDAFSILNNNQLNNKKLIADVVNTLSGKLTTLENNFYTNVTDFLANCLIDIQDFIDNLIYLGPWDSQTIYEKYNLVLYNNDVYMYISDTPSIETPPMASGPVSLIIDIAVTPSDSLNNGVVIQGGTLNTGNILSTSNLYVEGPWVKLEIRGATGAPGIGTTYIGQWNNIITYYQYNVVHYNDALWVAKATNSNVTPVSGTYWSRMFNVKRAKIENQSDVSTPYTGLIVFETIT